MDDRGQIFSEFQNFTGIDDAGRCFTILEQFNWNLQDAVHSTLNQMDSSILDDLEFINHPHLQPPTTTPTLPASTTPPTTPKLPSDLPSVSCHSNLVDDVARQACTEVAMETSPSSKMLSMHVEYRSQHKSLVMRDTDSVGRLKELLAEAFKLPQDQLEVHGWVYKNDHLIRDTDLLQNLNLPKDNYLYILTPKLPVTETSQSNGNKEEGFFRVTVKYLDENKEINLRFPPDKTIKQLKQDVGYCLSVPLRFQQWIGLPPEVKFTNKTTLGESGLPRLTVLELRSSGPGVSSEHLKATKNNSSEVESESEQGDLDTYADEDLEEDHTFRSAFKPLMPANSTDQTAGTESFCREFGLRYGELHPIFYIGSLDNAVKDSLSCKAKDRKMLAIYLHHDSSVFTNVFCSQVLCADTFISYLSTNFICWPWDLTSPSNVPTLLQTCSSHFGSSAASSINHRIDPPDHLPVILIIARHRGSNEVIELIEGNCNLSEAISRLIHATEINTTQLEDEIVEEAEREARDRVLAEQDAAYQESLAVDRAKEDSRRKEIEEREKLLKQQEEEIRESMSKKLKEQKEEQALQELLANNLPEEPPSNVDSSKSVISIKIRCPRGQTLSRRFYRQDHLSDLLNFITSQGYHVANFKLLTVYPRRDLRQQDPLKTFDDLGLASQEAINLEEL